MKNLVIALFITLLCSCQPQKAEQQPITEQEIQIAKELIQGSFDDLWAGVDSTKISKYHTDDFIILEQGEIWDNDRIKEYMRKQLARTERPKRTNRMEYISIDKYGESIQIAYYNFAEFTQADTLVGEAKWLESALAVSTKEGWKLKMMHSTWAGD
ncbi:hypothetical protein SAMN05661096_03333 [Marivirga sericea]|uniref:DUF4440 domain-containing protein n=1 Tax=Marivirga sericea TaxID=1028 RepID=A0A1X7KZD2_9BACT|nr:hypothetical protein [Marivirga sericea]SMG46956.1 hypothetical protein SAMN05661096_03333 [Marivirga sericea]